MAANTAITQSETQTLPEMGGSKIKNPLAFCIFFNAKMKKHKLLFSFKIFSEFHMYYLFIFFSLNRLVSIPNGWIVKGGAKS